MSLMDLIVEHAGAPALEQIGARVGLPPDMVRMAAEALSPALAGGLARHAQSGTLPAALPNGQVPGTDAAEAHGNDVLGDLLGSKDASRSVAADASGQTGIDVGILKAVLPQIASIAAAAMANRSARAGGLGGILSQLGVGR